MFEKHDSNIAGKISFSVTIVISEKVGFFMNGQLVSPTKKGNSWRVDIAYWNGLAVLQTQNVYRMSTINMPDVSVLHSQFFNVNGTYL